MASYYCVVNPVSGKGKALPLAARLAHGLKARGHDVCTMTTLPQSDAFRAACRAITVKHRVICIGGDGTLLYFINHCHTFESVAFYGMGTANVVSLEFAIPRDPDRFLDMLEENHCHHPRPGQTQDGTRFLMMCSFGIDGFILSRMSQRWKNRLGKSAFIWPTLRSLWSYPYPILGLELDGARRYEGSFALISRFRHYGGPYQPTPQADPCSDFYQLVILRSWGAWTTARFLAGLARGRLKNGGDVVIEQARDIVLHLPPQETWFQLDGDYHHAPITRLSVAENGFPLVVPRLPQLTGPDPPVGEK